MVYKFKKKLGDNFFFWLKNFCNLLIALGFSTSNNLCRRYLKRENLPFSEADHQKKTQAALRPLRLHNDTSGHKATKTRATLRPHKD